MKFNTMFKFSIALSMVVWAALLFGCQLDVNRQNVSTPTSTRLTVTPAFVTPPADVTATSVDSVAATVPPQISPSPVEATNDHTPSVVASFALDAAGWVKWTPDGEAFVFGGSRDGIDGVYHYDLKTSALTLVDQFTTLHPVTLSSDGALLGAGGTSMAIWSLSNLTARLRIDDIGIDCWLEFLPDSLELLRACLTTGVDPIVTQIAVWDWQADRLRPVYVPQGLVRNLAINRAGTEFVVALGRIGAALDDQIRSVDINSGGEQCQFVGFDFVLAPETEQLAVITQEGLIRHYELEDCSELARPTDISAESLPLPIDISPDGNMLYLVGREPSLFKAISIETKRVLFESMVIPGHIASMAISPDGRHLAVVVRQLASDSTEIMVWALAE